MADVDEIVCPICKVDIDMRDVLDYNVESAYGYNQAVIDIFGHLKIRVCHQCGFGFATPNLSRDSITRFYSTLYRSPGSPHYYKGNRFHSWDYSEHVLSQLLLLLNFCDLREAESLLDIGCGNGLFFHVAERLAIKLQWVGIEPDPYSTPWLKSLGVEVHTTPFAPASLQSFFGRKFDCIIMSHVLEHFHGNEVQTILTTAAGLLSQKGVLLCEVPHNDYRNYAQYRYGDTPHLSFFSRDSFELLCEESGLNVAFLGEVGMTIAQWWEEERRQHGSDQRLSFKAQAKHIARKLLPHWAIDLLRGISYHLKGDPIFQLGRHFEFRYGPGRIRLRAVLTKP
jgi:2-polyprenyl-3-methyl-5-hydroxy-6-metoxy-1,4-benzoquinol methylase